MILGIDPGTNVTGYAIIHQDDQKKLVLDTIGVIELKKTSLDILGKLKKLHDRVRYIIKEYKPTVLAIESPFYGKNVKVMQQLGRAQGIALALGLEYELEIHEYAPRKIKKSITGFGNASKEQVAEMLPQFVPNLNIKNVSYLLDATDALAVGVCHHFQSSLSGSSNKKYSDWDAFVSQNPNRIL